MVGAKISRQGKIGEGIHNHTHDLISETGIVENIYGISSGALITVDEASWCETVTLTKTLCELLLQAAVQVPTSG